MGAEDKLMMAAFKVVAKEAKLTAGCSSTVPVTFRQRGVYSGCGVVLFQW